MDKFKARYTPGKGIQYSYPSNILDIGQIEKLSERLNDIAGEYSFAFESSENIEKMLKKCRETFDNILYEKQINREKKLKRITFH